jgi:hypothetical protein
MIENRSLRLGLAGVKILNRMVLKVWIILVEFFSLGGGLLLLTSFSLLFCSCIIHNNLWCSSLWLWTMYYVALLVLSLYNNHNLSTIKNMNKLEIPFPYSPLFIYVHTFFKFKASLI